jgi:hypothetical protein
MKLYSEALSMTKPQTRSQKTQARNIITFILYQLT